MVEFLADREGVQCALDHQWNQVILESDSLQLVQSLGSFQQDVPPLVVIAERMSSTQVYNYLLISKFVQLCGT